ncbi:hypothetical protein CBOM_07952 [Ceraceosorus bombacis]|uniref:Uncharacterized protein n=1 Tax=Ceraceosorus bombacis TaxID=401625 RepID=A0A0P1BQV4_9BASI|nr:hypothetical protein CBOM_07952 [Ceraceosorus bombacis]
MSVRNGEELGVHCLPSLFTGESPLVLIFLTMMRRLNSSSTSSAQAPSIDVPEIVERMRRTESITAYGLTDA